MAVGFPLSLAGLAVTVAAWGFFEGLFGVFFAAKLNQGFGRNGRGWLSPGAIGFALFNGLIHLTVHQGISGFVTCFASGYAIAVIPGVTGNAWGSALVQTPSPTQSESSNRGMRLFAAALARFCLDYSAQERRARSRTRTAPFLQGLPTEEPRRAFPQWETVTWSIAGTRRANHVGGRGKWTHPDCNLDTGTVLGGVVAVET